MPEGVDLTGPSISVTSDGQVVGIIVAQYRNSQGLNFAVAINAVRELAAERGPGTKGAPSASGDAYPLNGRWSAIFQSATETFQAVIDLSQNAETLTGMMQTRRYEYNLDGEFSAGNGQLTLHAHGPGGREGDVVGTLAAPGLMRGTFDFRVFIMRERGIWAAQKVSPQTGR